MTAKGNPGDQGGGAPGKDKSQIIGQENSMPYTTMTGDILQGAMTIIMMDHALKYHYNGQSTLQNIAGHGMVMSTVFLFLARCAFPMVAGSFFCFHGYDRRPINSERSSIHCTSASTG